MASKKKSGPNLSQFVREHSNLSPAEIIAEGAKKGLKIKVGLIYNVRATDKKAKASGSAPKGKPGRKPKALTSGGSGVGNGIEAAIRSIVREEVKRFFADR